MTITYDSPDYWSLIWGIRDTDRAGGDGTLARLVTADWLEERGEGARAAYIRWCCGREDCRDTAHSWVHSDRPPTAPGGADVVWGQGFIAQVQCSLAWWLTHGPDLCRRHPVREVVVTDDGEDIARWAQRQYDAIATEVVVNGEAVTDPPTRYALALTQHFGPHNLYVSAITINATALLWAESEADRPV